MTDEPAQVLPRTLVNSTEGESVTFLISASETDNAFTYVEVILPPGKGTPMHYHLDFTEQFEAIEGALGIQSGKQIIHLQPGQDPAFVPLKTVHRFFNPGDAPVKFRAMIKPARHFEKVHRIIYGLSADGLCNSKGRPKSLLTLALVYELWESYLPGVPLFIQKNIFGLLARMARYLKKDEALKKYYTGTIEQRAEGEILVLEPWRTDDEKASLANEDTTEKSSTNISG